MVQGAGSNVGKSLLVHRMFRQLSGMRAVAVDDRKSVLRQCLKEFSFGADDVLN